MRCSILFLDGMEQHFLYAAIWRVSRKACLPPIVYAAAIR